MEIPTNIQLALDTAITGATPASLSFVFGFTVDETFDSGPPGNCPYPSIFACSDKVTFTNIETTKSFTLGGTPYTLAIVGFSTDGGTTFIDNFITEEGDTNQAVLYARFTTRDPPVPEPGSLLLLATALLGLGWAVRARRA